MSAPQLGHTGKLTGRAKPRLQTATFERQFDCPSAKPGGSQEATFARRWRPRPLREGVRRRVDFGVAGAASTFTMFAKDFDLQAS